MAYEQKPGQGSLFKNKKEKDSWPDYKGSLVADRHYSPGDKIDLAAWIKTPKSGGEKYVSLSIGKPREDKPAQTHASASHGSAMGDDLDDGIPFAPMKD